MSALVLSKPTDVASPLIVRYTYTQVHKWNIQSSLELLIMIVPTFLWSISWGHQHLQFFEHTLFELVTLNLPLHEDEIHLWFTSPFLYSSTDTLQHRALHDSRIFGLWPISVSLLTPSHHLRSLLKHASRSSTFILAVHFELSLIYVMHEIFFINLNSRFNHICMLSNLRHHISVSYTHLTLPTIA